LVIPREADHHLLLLLLGGILPDFCVAGRSISGFRKDGQVCFTVCERKFPSVLQSENSASGPKAGIPHENAYLTFVHYG
jgi:hypothetical protein